MAANYRAACPARSKQEFDAKPQIVIEEADESAFWLEMVIDSGLLEKAKIAPLLQEANELTTMMVASRKTTLHSSQSAISDLQSPIYLWKAAGKSSPRSIHFMH